MYGMGDICSYMIAIRKVLVDLGNFTLNIKGGYVLSM